MFEFFSDSRVVKLDALTNKKRIIDTSGENSAPASDYSRVVDINSPSNADCVKECRPTLIPEVSVRKMIIIC